MEPSAVFDCVVRVKEEPSEVTFTEYKDEFIDEPTDFKNVQLLLFPQDDSCFKLQKYDGNHESQVDDIKIEFECKDEMPSMNSLLNHSQDVKYGDNYNTNHVIKMETVGQVKTELIGDHEENSKLNFNRELKKVNEKRRNSRKSDRQHRPKSPSDTAVHNGIVHACVKSTSKQCIVKSLLNVINAKRHSPVKSISELTWL
ncbi:uncharacterized protein LOC106652734 [Trichogramma pretiosum]|uniref:uncharacterized protein LOC106652734 n=1 Tax=Trichogramma pretiosum TaxID=7493 RepID=UPI0006C9DEC3|nr:uncharacterized protein LOC106652734 [Trichogramma pretiosum]